MSLYEWHGDGVFQDSINSREIHPGDVVDIDDRLVGNHDFVKVDEPETEDDTPETLSSDDEPTEGESDYASMDYSELSELAKEADTDEIHGRSSREDIVAYFEE